MASFNYGERQHAGDLYIKTHGAYPGSLFIDGNAECAGDIDCVNLTVSGNITIQSSTIVDVFAGTVYTYGDPNIRLNTTFSGDQVIDAGISLERKAGFNDAVLFYSDPDIIGTAGAWKAGISGSELNIVTIPAGTANAFVNGVMRWDGAKAIATTEFTVGTAVIGMSYPFDARYATGLAYKSYMTSDDYETDLFTIGHRTLGLIDNSHAFGWANPNILGFVVANVPTYMSSSILNFSSGNTGDGEMRFVLGDCLAIRKNTTTGVAEILGQSAGVGNGKVRIDGPADVYLTATTGVHINGTAADCSAPMTFTGAVDTTAVTLTAGVIVAVETQVVKETHTLLGGFLPIPTPGGWTGDITRTGVTYNVTTTQRLRNMSYELRVVWDNRIAGPEIPYDTQFTFEIPLNIDPTGGPGDMANIRNIRGVTLRRAAPAGAVINVYPIQETAMMVVAGYELDPVFLTAANMTDFNVLMLTVIGKEGYYEAIITVEIQVA